MPLSQYQWERVGECEECDAPIYYNEDEGRLTSPCNCMTIDPNTLPEWVQHDIGYEPEPLASIENLEEAHEENRYLEPYGDDSKAADHLNEEARFGEIIDPETEESYDEDDLE